MGFVEYRYTAARHRPGPYAALEATERDLFVGAGLFFDIPVGRRWVFTPSLGAAIYREHDGLGLGDPVEFRATAEFTYGLDETRFGASFGHFSNAGIGETNPGVEILKLVWVMPLDRRGSPHGGSGRRGMRSGP